MAEGGGVEQLSVSGDTAKTKMSTGPEFLETPEGRQLAYHRLPGSSPGVVFIHGLKSNMNGHKSLAIEAYCSSRGIAFVRFELSGHGDSSQNFKDCNVTMWLEDLNAILSSLTKGQQILVGSSIGGWLMFLYTMRNPDTIYGLLGLSVAADLTQEVWKGLDKETKREVRKTGIYHLKSAYDDMPYEISLDLIQDGAKYTILDMPGIEYVKCPVTLFHGVKDSVIPVSTALNLMQRLQCPVELKTIDDGEHRLSRPQDIELILESLGNLLLPVSEDTDSKICSSSESED